MDNRTIIFNATVTSVKIYSYYKLNKKVIGIESDGLDYTLPVSLDYDVSVGDELKIIIEKYVRLQNISDNV